MKKIYLMIVGTLFATTSLAQVTFPTKANAEKATSTVAKEKLRTRLKFNLANAVSKRHAKTGTPITKQPEGTVMDTFYRSSSESYFIGWGSVFRMPVDGFVGTLVKGTDGSLYMADPFAMLASNTWLKLDKADGDTLVAKANQMVFQVEYEDGARYDFYASHMVARQTEEGELTYVIDPDDADIKFVFRNDSLIQLGDGIIGMHSEEGEWAGYGDMHTVFSTVRDQVVEASPSLAFTDYVMKFMSASGGKDGQIVKVAFDGDNVYLKGTSPNMPEAMILGRIDGNKLVFDSEQYMGIDKVTQSHAYFFGGTAHVVHNDEYDIDEELFFLTKSLTFKYDAANRQMTADSAVCVNTGKKLMAYIYFFKQPDMGVFTEMPLTPQQPTIISFSKFDPEMGYATLLFEYPKFDAEGRFMNPEKLTYKIFRDNEELTFYPDEYIKLETETNEMPYNYDDRSRVFVNESAHSVCIFEDGYDKIGVLCIYRGGNETHESPMAWHAVNGETGVDTVNTGEIETSHYIDMQGRAVQHPAQGIYVRMDRLKNGSKKYTKVLVR
ncbi:MAG: hypothetical protein PUH24_06300 [Prevotellaceae bacterium]|nr:hypothetical protein [Prevotella sp.]MDD7257863.1 hypothetical protein [Prevotellaceae bacterium]MDY6130567.1 hypothetical protein [Prevotella sp.]